MTKFDKIKNSKFLTSIALVLFFLYLGDDTVYSQNQDSLVLFSRVPAQQTGITFINTLVEDEAANILTYQYLYNGGGVAAGDLNNDGLADLVFTANQSGDKIFLNKGGFVFEDITGISGINQHPGWSTGVTLADVNADGLLDIYICRSGKYDTNGRRNKLYINHGDLTFTEQAERYNLNDSAYSTMAAFFDYDIDGDLDMFLLNHSVTQYKNFIVEDLRKQRDPLAGNKLYRNDGGYYLDVSEAAGIKGNPINFGLGVSTGDLNNDGYPDILCTNDYQEQDYIYINNKNGTFTQVLEYATAHTSNFSMGCDIADVNNDGFQDFITVDMLPEDNYRQKKLKGPQKYDAYQLAVEYGFYHQVMKNALQINNINGTFSDIAALSGVANTDWSWSPLFADFDNDGFKDLHITNGYRRDFTDMDFIKYTYAEETEKARKEGKEVLLMDIVNKMPSVKTSNYIFRNTGALQFENVTQKWGLHYSSFSNGAAYADLDNDGDLDLVINNINDEAFLFRNNAEQKQQSNYLKIKLTGENKNPFGIGAKVTLTAGDKKFVLENYPTRGYQSSVEPVLHCGLGNLTSVDVLVEWPGGKTERRIQVPANTTLHFFQHEAETSVLTYPEVKPVFNAFQSEVKIQYHHYENAYIDFKREPLLPHQLSRNGPALDIADINHDGYADVFVGGTTESPGKLFLQSPAGRFTEDTIQGFTTSADQTACVFFDADNDHDTDLYIASGGNEYEADAYKHNLYMNNGKGVFTASNHLLPALRLSSICVKTADFDLDGDTDLFIGGYCIPGKYPLSPASVLLENTGEKFVDVTSKYFSDANFGMVKDALWQDMNADGLPDLIVAGEWTPIQIFINKGHVFEELQHHALQSNTGWWNCLSAADFDHDGDIDLLAGNRGLNSQVKATLEKPVTMYAYDFDKNGTLDPIINYYIGDTSYPLPSRDELLDQIISLKKKFVRYQDYATATMQSIFPNIDADTLPRYTVTQFATCYVENTGGGNFVFHPLPVQAQVAPVTCILANDYNTDGTIDVLLAGNDFTTRPELGRMDAGQGLLLLGNGVGHFKPQNFLQSGVYLPGQVAEMKMLKTSSGTYIIAAKNNTVLQVLKLNN